MLTAKSDLNPALTNIKNMMTEIDRVFRTNSGKKRNYNFKVNIDTGKIEEKLCRVKTLLSEIREFYKGINVSINAGQPLESKRMKAKTMTLLEKNGRRKKSAY